MPVDQSARDLKPERSPGAGLPLSLMGFGAVNLALMAALLVREAPAIAAGSLRLYATLAVTHLFTLGFATPVAMGALYQMVPVLLYSRLARPRLAGLQAALHMAGTWVLVLAFYRWRTLWFEIGGGLVLVSFLLFLGVLTATLRRAGRYQLQLPVMAAAAGHLLLTGLWGLTLAFNLRRGFLGSGTGIVATHAALGLLGWLLLLTAGVSYRLVPMFAGSTPGPVWPRRIALPVLAAVPVPLALAAGLGLWPAARALGLLEAAAVTLYAADLLGIIRRRRTPRLEYATGYTAAAAAALMVAALLAAAALAWPGAVAANRPRRVLAIAAVAVLGWQGTMIMGQLLRIVPFIIWLSRFRRRWLRERIPTLQQMVGGRWPWLALMAWLAGVAGTAAVLWLGDDASAGRLLRLPAAVLAAGAGTYSVMLLATLRHLYHRPPPGVRPVPDPAAAHLRPPRDENHHPAEPRRVPSEAEP